MSIFKEVKKALKIVKCFKEIKKVINSTHIAKDSKEDIEIINEASKRLANRVPIIGELIITIKDLLK